MKHRRSNPQSRNEKDSGHELSGGRGQGTNGSNASWVHTQPNWGDTQVSYQNKETLELKEPKSQSRA